jgi:hypothetical protein
MRIPIRIQLITYDVDPDFNLIRIQVPKMMRIRIHNTGCG